MNCTEVKDLLSDYYDVELAPENPQRVAAQEDRRQLADLFKQAVTSPASNVRQGLGNRGRAT